MKLTRLTAAYLSVACVFIVSSINLNEMGNTGSWIKSSAAALPVILALVFLTKDRFHSPSLNKTGFYLLMAILILAILSLAWSIDSPATHTAIIAWIYTISVAYLLVSLGTPLLAATVLVLTFGWLCLLSLALSLFWPDAFVLNHGVMRLQGIFYGPHALARPAAICLCIIASGAVLVRRPLLFTLTLVIGVCLLLTFSRQAITAGAIGVIIALFMRVRTYSHVAIIGSLCVFLVIGLFHAYSSGHDLAEITSRGEGDDVQSLTGRTFIWEAAFELINQKPYFGYGFGAGGTALEEYYRAGTYGWSTFNTHNAFLQILLDLGAAGLILFLIVLVYWLVRCFFVFPALSFSVFVCVMLLSFVERGFYSVGGFIPLVLMLALLARNYRIARSK
ncbi:MAG: O-antigen ligase family protein [Nitrosomonas sp.]|nr:O-antigen ligase family protein [Nitrosomonas sp.]